MFVLAGDAVAPLALRDVATKDALPFEELLVVAGAVPAAQQLTCLSARVRPWKLRVLLLLPLPAAAAVQILEVGDGAVQFAQDVRGCFPTLVRRNPLAFAPDSDNESGDDDDDDDNAKEKEARDESHRQQQLAQDAATFMSRSRVKLVASLGEVFHAFEIADRANVHAALQQQCGACQWLCIDLPAQWQPLSAVSPAPGAHDCGVLFTHACSESPVMGSARCLQIPLPRTPRGYFAAEDPDAEVFQDATVLSFGARREATSRGGGKTPAEMVQNIRMRHASGTFCTLVAPETTWAQVATKYDAVLPQTRALGGDLRLRRIMGPAANAGVELVLQQQ